MEVCHIDFLGWGWVVEHSKNCSLHWLLYVTAHEQRPRETEKEKAQERSLHEQNKGIGQ